ncbi:MAG: gamma-glutamyl-gamma-aminobutyrate hydrolase family protein [Actinobacteria bacterium]|nr:gamma-glutamyl-gamma-aminobutyrate hydrolase family protein [Actinomycetota bacterium]
MASDVRPLVAVPTARVQGGRIEGWGQGAYAVADTYVAALRRAGARPVLLTSPDPDPAEEVLAPFAGLLLAGGGDVDPRRYATGHDERDERIYGVDPDRDDLELDLAAFALESGLPTLAICRGAQVVNVARGGSLYQHLPGPLGRGAHGDPTSGVVVTHGVRVVGDSRLAAVVGSSRLGACTSVHHQGIDRLGEGLRAVAWSDDGLVEALEPDGNGGWLVAVQWHPEVTAAHDPAQQALFDALTEQARHRAADRAPSEARLALSER